MEDLGAGLDVAAGLPPVVLFSSSPRSSDALVLLAFDLTLPTAGALGTEANLPVPAPFDPPTLPAGGLVTVLVDVFPVNFAEAPFDPGPTLEAAISAPLAVDLGASDSFGLIAFLAAILFLIEEPFDVLEGFFGTSSPGLLSDFPPTFTSSPFAASVPFACVAVGVAGVT